MSVYHDIFLATRIRINVYLVDLDPAKWYGSNRIRIRNTDSLTRKSPNQNLHFVVEELDEAVYL